LAVGSPLAGQPGKNEPKYGSWRYPQRSTLGYLVAALGEMKREQPLLSDPPKL
jgi:hypothetical protein